MKSVRVAGRPIRRILAIKLRAMGDTVLMSAALGELRRQFPDARIDVAATAPWCELLEGHPGVDRLWPYQRHNDRAARAKAIVKLALKLRKENYDCVVNFHASPSSSMLAFSTGAPLRAIHYHGHNDRNRYSTVSVPGKGTVKPIIERDMDTVRALGLQIPTGIVPRIHLRKSELEDASTWFKTRDIPQPVLAIGLGASRPTKQWPVERFAELALAWRKETQGGVIAITGPNEDPLLTAFFASMSSRPESASLSDKIVPARLPTLRKLASVLARSSVYVGNDSGPKHVAVAVGAPTVTVFGPEDPFEWHPYPRDQHPYLFIEKLECRKDATPGLPPWCAVHHCVAEAHRCMKSIGAEQVMAECRKVARK